MISVITVAHNREHLLPRSIESTLNQTFRNFELIINDHGSTDRSGQIAEEYAARDKRIRVLHTPPSNCGSGRNAGLDAAWGEYCVFVDDDDHVEPTFLEHLYTLAKKHDADVVCSGAWWESDGTRIPKYVFDGTYTYSGENAVIEMLKREKFNCASPGKLYSCHAFEGLRYSVTDECEDIGLTYKILAQSNMVVADGIPLYIFSRHGGNNSCGTVPGEYITARQIEIHMVAFAGRTRWLTERFPDKADYWLYTELSYALSMYDKTDNMAMRGKLKDLINRHKEALLSAERYYTQRDISLIKFYGLEIFG